MLKVLTILPLGGLLTADITTISADTIEITADAENIGSTTSEHILTVPYREYYSDVNLNLKNELTQVESIISITATQSNGMMKVEFQFTFEEGDSYEANIRKETTDELLWRGKIYITDQTDLNNFDLLKTNTVDGIITI